MKKILPALIVMLAIVGCTTQAPTATNIAPPVRTQGAITVDPPWFNFGEIKQQNGPVSTTFTLTNTSDETLRLNRLSTSCGCTTATMDMADLAQGESRTMTATFDPLTHPDQFGPIERVIYLQTSDPNLSELQIDLMGNVIP